ncbi:LytTR family DNA-binding domain-containing protein [Oscillospiraceae bacterium 21-37]
MQIKLEEDSALEEMEVLIRCPRADGEAQRLLALLRAMDGRKLTGEQGGQTYLLDMEEVLYIDTVDRKTFLYTAEGVFETPLRLYELEDRLIGRGFFRASKSVIVNFNAIQSLRPDLGGRLRLTMRGGEAVYVSRQYAAGLKKRLGL